MSNPIKRKLLADIEAKGGFDMILERIEGGETVLKLAKEFGVSRGFFSRILHSDDERSDKVKRARVLAAYAAVDEMKQIADDVEATRDDIAKAKLRIEARQFIARTSNPEEFGEKKGPLVQLNIGQLHLDALRSQAAVQQQQLDAQRASERPALPAEVESVE